MKQPLHHDNEPLYKLIPVLVFTLLFWSLSWPVSKIALRYMDPIWFTECRVGIAMVVVFLVLFFSGKLAWPKRHDWFLIIAIGVFQVGLFQVFMYLGLQHVNVDRSAIIIYSTPIWVTPVAILFFKEAFSWLKGLGLLLGIVGILVLFDPTHFDWHDRAALWGNLFLVISAICWSIAILCARYAKWHSGFTTLLPWQLLVGAICIALTLPEAGSLHATHWTWQLIVCIAYSVLFATAYGYWSAVYVSKHLPAVTTSLAFLGVPIGAALLSNWILHEALSTLLLVSMISIVLGLAIVSIADWRLKKVL